MTVTLKNQFLTVLIEDAGAQLCSVKNTAGTEYIWQADPAVWGRHAPLLFPVIGRLRDGQYTHKGTTYTIPSHGFARDSLFEVAEQTDARVVFRLTHSESTLAVYPFPFTLTVTYTLEDNRLVKSCTVENTGGEELLYELGGHDGFTAPLEEGEVMDDYAILLPGLEAITPYGMDEACMITPKGAIHPLDNGRVPLKPAVYGLDTVILGDLPSAGPSWPTRRARPGSPWTSQTSPIWGCGHRASPLTPTMSASSPGPPCPTPPSWAGPWPISRASAPWPPAGPRPSPTPPHLIKHKKERSL